jgi:hypothetical protein
MPKQSRPDRGAWTSRQTQEYPLSAQSSVGQKRRAYADLARTNRRRTVIGGTLVSLVLVNELPLDALEPAHHHPIVNVTVVAAAAILGSDYLLEGLIRLKRWLSGRVVIIDFGSRSRPPRE